MFFQVSNSKQLPIKTWGASPSQQVVVDIKGHISIFDFIEATFNHF